MFILNFFLLKVTKLEVFTGFVKFGQTYQPNVLKKYWIEFYGVCVFFMLNSIQLNPLGA